MLRKSILAAVFLFFASLPSHALLFDHSGFDSVLKHYVNEDGYVDYDGIRQNSLSALESYFERLADADLGGWTREEKLAFWINAYNARAIYLIANRPKLKKISENFDLYNFPFKVAGQTLSLNDIEHRILRNGINPDNKKGPIPFVSIDPLEPRVHFALVRGTVSDPRLRTVAYTAENVGDMLQSNAVQYANSPKYLDVADQHLRVSSLMKWCGKDFAALGGWRKFLSDLIDPDKRGGDAAEVQRYLGMDDKKIEYRYDWTINDIRNAGQ